MTYCLTISSAAARSSGVKSIRSSTVTPCRSNGGGLVGNGCVGDVCSPGVFDCGTGRSSIGHTGCPVTRSKTNANACFVSWTTALIRRPSTVMSARIGRRRQVVVPQVVMNELVVPDAFAGLALDAHEGVRKQVVAGTMPAVHVARRAGERQIGVAELFVDADERPEVRVPGVLPRVVLPRLDAELSGSRDHVEGPAQLPGADVVAPHVAREPLLARRRVAHRGADDHDVSADLRRTAPRVVGSLAEPESQIDDAVRRRNVE